MHIIEVKSKSERKQYINFIYNAYKDDKNYCDMNLIFVKNFLYKQDNYSKRCIVRPIMIIDETIKLVCMFIIDESCEIKMSFLEFLPNSQKYLKKLIKYSKTLITKYKKDKVVVGINGQVSYGLGILVDKYNKTFEFNSNYNRNYYTKEMDEIFPIMKRAFSYKYEASNSLSLFDDELLNNVHRNYQFRYFDIKHFKKDMMKFGDLVHKSLKGTPYYSDKTPYEMYQLMKQLKFVMKKEDIIFAMKDGQEIGFVYTHPDYAELFDRPKLNYLKFYIRYLFKRPKNIIYNVIGVLPEHQLSGIAVGLIHYAIKTRGKAYPVGSSSFILEDNIPSTKLCKKLSVGINKEYHLYEICGDENV